MAIENVNRNDSLSGIVIIRYSYLTKCRCLVLTVR